jgi:coenzyme F420-dependent glucose-6-phosphate dehydrogenase
MTTIGYHCSHERFKPSERDQRIIIAFADRAANAVEIMQLYEEVGFDAGMCSDHFHPWNEEQGQSGYTWSWLGAAMQATQFSFGMVCAPGQRYNPAIIAQAAATLAEMFPDRLWCSFGSGQFLNEHITGDGWLPKLERQSRLKEAVDVIRAQWAGETVTHRGYFTVEEAKLYTRPQQPPLILGAALSEKTAEWVGSWADGVITVAKPRAEQEKFIEAFQRGGGTGKPMYLQALHAYAADYETALQGAWKEWRTNLFGSEIQADLKTPQHFEAVGKLVRPEDMTKGARVSADIDDHMGWLKEDIELGFDSIFVHNAAAEQADFIRVFAEKVLPELKPKGAKS